MRILLVSHTAMSRTAGQPRLHALANHPDFEVTALVPDRMNFYGKWETAETPVNPKFRYVIGAARGQNVAGQWYLQHYPTALKALICELKPDVLDLWHEPWSLVSAQAIALARKYSPQTRILTETEQNIYKRLPPPFAQFQAYTLRHAHYLVGRNAEAIEVARRKGWQGESRVIPNSVDCDLFQPAAARSQNEIFRIGYVGRLVPEKGLSDLLAAFAHLPNDSELILAGEGSMRQELEAQAQTLGIASRVTFVGNMPYLALPPLMQSFDVLVLPSRTTATWKEQFGRVLIEAGACGIPVIGSSSGAIPEVIADAGLVFPEGDIARLAGCLNQLKDSPQERETLGKIGRERAVWRYSWKQTAKFMAAIYHEMRQRGNRENSL